MKTVLQTLMVFSCQCLGIKKGQSSKITHVCKSGMSSNKDSKFTNIKGVLFDVDGTLYYQAPLRVIMIFLLFAFNIHRPKEFLRKLKVVIYYRRSQEEQRRSPQVQEEIQKSQLMLAAAKTHETLSYVSDVIEEWFDRRPLSFIHLCRRREINEAIGLMQKKGLKLGVFSDYPAREKLDALGISSFISTVICAGDPEVCGFKPKTNGFAIAAAKMGLKPSEIVYVGDRPDVDGLGASDAGMKVVILNGLLRNKNTGYPSFSSLCDVLLAME